MHKLTVVAALALSAAIFSACKKDDSPVTAQPETYTRPTLPSTPYSYASTAYPAHIQNALNASDNTPAGNPITDDGATLGRVLFYDKHLSKNNTVACASCHKQEESFADNSVFSSGFDGGLTTRHSMPILNVRFYRSGKMFWDERAATVEAQALLPIQNQVEMGLTLTELVTKLSALDYYPPLFQKAFGSATIDTTRIARAIAQFVRSIVTYQSKYDRVKQGLETFTADEAQGEQLFLNAGNQRCAGCHPPPMFLTSSPVAPFALRDPNDAGINNENRFKSGTLRNISVRSSLFHNGSITNTQAMLASGPGTGTQAIPAHSVAPQDVPKFAAFLNTLTDNTIATEARFSDPFK